MKTLSIALLLLAFSLRSVAQTILGAEVQAGGHAANIWIDKMATNGVFSNGLGAYNQMSGAEKLRLTVLTPGFEDDGTTNQNVRIAIGTAPLPVYGTDFTNSETYARGVTNVLLQIALSEFVRQGEIVTADFASGLYTQGGTNSAAASGLSVTNSSTQPWEQVIARWVLPDRRYIQSNLVTNYVKAYHWSGQQYRPVRAVRGTVSDGTNSVSVWATREKLVHVPGWPIRFAAYELVFDCSSFPQPNYLGFSFTAYPWWGTTNAVLDTAVNGFWWRTGLPHVQTNLVDATGAFNRAHARVATNGVDASGVAVKNTYWLTNNTPAAFLTIGAAIKAIAASNNTWFARNDASAGVVHLGASLQHTWLGSSLTLANGPKCYVTIEPDTSLDYTSVGIDKQGTDSTGLLDNDMWHFRGLTLSLTNNNLVSAPCQAWFENCQFVNMTAASPVTGNTGQTNQAIIHATGCYVSNYTQGFGPFSSGHVLTWDTVAGNTFAGPHGSMRPMLFEGNLRLATCGTNFTLGTSTMGPQSMGYEIYADSAVLGVAPNTSIAISGWATNVLSGVVMANLLFEQIGYPDELQAFSLWLSAGKNNTNALLVGCTDRGGKFNNSYNDSGSTAYYRWLFHFYQNFFDDYNIKGHNFTPYDAGRTGNIPVLLGTGHFANLATETTGVGAFGFFPQFQGLNSFDARGTGSGYPTNWARWVDDRGNNAVTNGATGGGTYRLQNSSPLHYWLRNNSYPIRQMLGWDLDGYPRSEVDPPGALVSGNPIKGL